MEVEDSAPVNIFDHFKDYEDVVQMIKDLKKSEKLEKSYERYSDLLSRYQEQPHLLDHHIPELISLLVNYIKDPILEDTLKNEAYKYMYQICKVRSYKLFVKFLPHELSDLDFVLELLVSINFDDTCWEKRYILLVWMTILVLNPFDLARLDANNSKIPKMEQMYQICKLHTKDNDPCANVAAFFCAKFLIRYDMKSIYLKQYFNWIINEHDRECLGIGQLSAVAAILKHGKREDLQQYTNELLTWITSLQYTESKDFLRYKYYLKIIQRLGLVFLPQRKLASWRYQRGTRSLTMNLPKGTTTSTSTTADSINSAIRVDNLVEEENDEDFAVPDQIEEVIEELLQGLRSSSSDCRWLSAKGVGRICNRLPKTLGDEVVGSITEILNPLEAHEGWHGACLALAELAKRGLLLPHRLPYIVPLLMQALTYDEMKSYMPVGLNIRDAACYMCWAIARAYNPIDLKPFVVNIASALLVTTCFDREINCRRAASAAFQESVGRLGNFPHGIDILTTADFFSVGLRTNAYLHISDYIGQFDEYIQPLIDHLVERKINHWDIAIRELTAQALHTLTKHKPTYVHDYVMPKLINNSKSIDVNCRHGSILAIGEVILALKLIDPSLISSRVVHQINGLVSEFQKREQFRGISGELMRLACTNFIQNCSKAQIQIVTECLESWQQLIDLCIINKTDKVRESAIKALPTMSEAYYINDEFAETRYKIVSNYLKQSQSNLEEHFRMGYVGALGSLPKFMLINLIDDVITILIKLSKIPGQDEVTTLKWSEARRESVKALSNICTCFGYETGPFSNQTAIDNIFACYFNCLTEYTLDNRGDIGAWVREASMVALTTLVTSLPKQLLRPEHVVQTMQGLSKQAVENIDRTRGMAGKLFSSIVHYTPKVEHIPHHDELKEIFPVHYEKVLWLFAYHTFPMFCSLLAFPIYSKNLILGLAASIGNLSESLVICFRSTNHYETNT